MSVAFDGLLSLLKNFETPCCIGYEKLFVYLNERDRLPKGSLPSLFWQARRSGLDRKEWHSTCDDRCLHRHHEVNNGSRSVASRMIDSRLWWFASIHAGTEMESVHGRNIRCDPGFGVGF